MKITAKMAYSQLKVNRSRTIWTLLAIALSTSLTTAVCFFVASGNAMIVDFLGPDYGDYGHSYIGLLLIPAIIFGALIVAMSIIVISNVFRISAQERVTQFGIMKCTGATKRQIIETVMKESFFLCAAGIPMGLILGLLFAFFGTGIANLYLKELDALAHIMIEEISLSLRFVWSWWAILVSAALSFCIVLVSAYLPARRASKISALDCIRNTTEVKISAKQVRTNPFVEAMFGFEGTLAVKNHKRSKRNFRATVISLSVGVIMFIGLESLGQQAAGIENSMNMNIEETIIAEYMSDYDETVHAQTNREQTTYLCPIDSERGNDIALELEKYENTVIWGMGEDRDTYYTVISQDQLTEDMRQALQKQEIAGDEFPVEIITLDTKNYTKLCETANCVVGSVILLNEYNFNDFGEKISLVPFSDEMTEITLYTADGSAATIPIQAALTSEQIPAELFYINTNPVRLVVPQAMVRGYSWYAASENPQGFIAYANEVLAREFPTKTASSYMEEGFSTRVYLTDEYMQVMNIAISLATVFMYSFVILLMLIGLTNVISTLSTNVMMRAREFAVLKSVGMTSESLKKMLTMESILCSCKALLYGLPIGILITFLVNLPIRMILPVPYRFPWASIVECTLTVLFLTWSTTRYAAHKLKNQNLIETIRSESGR